MAFADSHRHESHGQTVDRVVDQLDERQVGLLGSSLGELHLGDDALGDEGSHGGLVGGIAGHEVVELLDREQTMQNQDLSEAGHAILSNGLGK